MRSTKTRARGRHVLRTDRPWLRFLVALGLLVTVLVPLTAIGPAAEAATVSIGAIQAQVSDHHGTDSGGTDSNNCIKYSPANTTTSSAFVTSTGEALTAHGYSTTRCPGSLDKATQSAVGVTPAATSSVQDGIPFLLARVVHYNNPVSVTSSHFTGNLSLRVGGFDTTPTLTYGWAMWETPNSLPCPIAYPGQGSDCVDQITFSGQIPDQTLTKDGITYKLVVNGFAATDGTCPATMPSSTQNEFLTKEKSNSAACVYASLVQVRKLTVVKKIVAPAGVTPPSTAFGFGTTSNLAGSPWSGTSFSLSPTLAAPASYGPKDLLQGETVGVTETVPAGGKWAVTGIACTDGTGAAVPITRNIGAGTMTLSDVGAPATAAAGPVTCTYTNTYTPQAKLTLVKDVDGGTAKPSAWTLSAQGPTPVSGASGSAEVTAQTVTAGDYALAEAGGPIGYTQVGWSCKTKAGATVPVTGGKATLADSADVTCTVTNHYARGTFKIHKVVEGPAAGYTGSASTPFTGTYKCDGGTAQPFSVSTGADFVSPEMPAGTSCTVTETAPTGNLADSSWSWNAPSYSNGASATIADGSTPTVTITNSYAQKTGSFTVNKVVAPRAGVPAAGYTGGSRTFPIDYTCTIGGSTVKSGTVDVADGGQKTVSGVPATASCAISETLQEKVGDFADPSLAWDGYGVSRPSVTVTDGGNAQTTVTNYFTKQTASLTVQKVLTDPGYTGGTDKVFTVDWDCGTASGSFDLAKGGSNTVTVPARTSCTVTERDPSGHLAAAYDWGTPTYAGLTGGSISVPANGSGTVTITNHTVPVFGAVSVTKKVTGESSGVDAAATYPLTVACDAPAQGATGNYTHTFQALAGVTQTSPELPVGTTCTVTEGALPPVVDDSYAWGAKPGPQQVTVAKKGIVAAVTVTNTLERVYGSFHVTKAVEGIGGANGASTAFHGTWSCTDGSSGTWSTTGAGSASLTGPGGHVLLTATCRVDSEDDPTTPPSGSDKSYVWGAKDLGDPVTLTKADPSGTTTVTNTVKRAFGAFTVTKSVQGGEPGTAFVDDDFSFHYACTSQSGEDVSGDLQAHAGQTAQLPAGTQVPDGSKCTVTETGRPDAIAPYTWDTGGTTYSPGEGDHASFTVDAATPVSVSVTNALSKKSVTVHVRKVVDDPDGGYEGDTKFQATLVCTVAGNTTTYGPVAVAADGTADIDGVLLGSRCDVTEAPPAAGDGLADASYAWGAPTYSGAQTISLGGDHTFTVTNHVVRVRGPLGLTKVVDDPDHVTDPARTYSGAWSCTHPGDPDVTGTWTVDGAGTATLTGVPDDGVLLNSNCTPTEQAPTTHPSADPSYHWAEPTIAAARTTAGRSATMTVTNKVTRTIDKVTVAKRLSGETAGYDRTGTAFTVGYTCYLHGPDDASAISGNVAVAPGAGPVTLIDDVPAGWTCRVQEQTAAPGLLVDRSYSWGDPTYTGVDGDQDLTVGDDSAVVVTNPIVRNTGSFVVTKQIADGTPDGVVADDAPFAGTWQCSYRGDVVADGSWSVDGTGRATMTPAATGIPATSRCSATETAPADSSLVDASWTWGAPQIGDPVTVEAVTDPAELTVVNHPERVYASLKVTKKFAGPDRALTKGASVTGVWSCTYDGTQVGSGRWTLPATGGTTRAVSASDQVPNTSQCTVVEDTPSPDALVDGSYAWEDPTYSPDGGQVTLDGSSAEVTVTNGVHRVYGSLAITKRIVLEGTPRTGTTFSGDWSCHHGDDAAVTGTWSVTDEGTYPIDGVLIGSVCEVTGEDAPTAGPSTDPSYVWAGNDVSPGTVTVAATGDPVQLTVTNKTKRLHTHLVLAKTLEGDTKGEPAGQTYDLSYKCTDASGGKHTGSHAVAAGESWSSPDDIPVGSTCTVTEGTLPDVAPRDVWEPVDFTLDGAPEAAQGAQHVTFTLPSGSETAAPVTVHAMNTLKRQEAGYTITKTSDPGTGATVTPGQAIKYTVRVQPSGEGTVDDVAVTDDLTDVLPYADVTDVDASQGTAKIDADAKEIDWQVGTVSGSDPLTLTYVATVKTGAYGVTIRNQVAATGEQPPSECGSCTTTTEHPVAPMWTVQKHADPASGSTVEPGQTVTYTLTVTNGSTVAPLAAGTTITDDLSQVLAHATFTGIKPGGVGTATRAGSTLTWSLPEVAAGATRTLSYTVKVDPNAWGVTLRNVVTGTNPSAPPSPICDPPAAGGSADLLSPASVGACQVSTEHHTPPRQLVSPPEAGDPPASSVVDAPSTADPGSSGGLPNTGASLLALPALALGGLLVLGGVLLVRRTRARS